MEETGIPAYTHQVLIIGLLVLSIPNEVVAYFLPSKSEKIKHFSPGIPRFKHKLTSRSLESNRGGLEIEGVYAGEVEEEADASISGADSSKCVPPDLYISDEKGGYNRYK